MTWETLFYSEDSVSKSGRNWIAIVNIGNPKSENSQDYAQKPQQNGTFMNSASGHRGLLSTRTLSRLSSNEVTSAGTASWLLIIAWNRLNRVLKSI